MVEPISPCEERFGGRLIPRRNHSLYPHASTVTLIRSGDLEPAKPLAGVRGAYGDPCILPHDLLVDVEHDWRARREADGIVRLGLTDVG